MLISCGKHSRRRFGDSRERAIRIRPADRIIQAPIRVIIPASVQRCNASDEGSLENAERFGAVQDAILTTDLKDSLAAAQDEFSVFGVKQINIESGIEGNQWRGKIRVGMMVCGSAL